MAKKKEQPKKESYSFQYNFSKEELEEKSKQLAQACQDRSSLEDEKKSASSDFKAKIDGKNAEISLISNHIHSGHERVTKTCEVVKDFGNGVKTYSYEGNVVGTERLTAADHQQELPLGEEGKEEDDKDGEQF